jgi:hypothetical protein
MNLVGRDESGDVWLRRRIEGTWGPWMRVGFTSDDVPAAVQCDNNGFLRMFPITVGNTGQFREELIGARLDEPLRLEPNPEVFDSVRGSRIVAVRHNNANRSTDLFARGENNRMWHKRRDAEPISSWGDWQNFGGEWRYAPAAMQFSRYSNPARTVVFAVGRNEDALWFVVSDGKGNLGHHEGWSDWIKIGGTVMSTPTAVDCQGLAHVFYRGENDHLWHTWGEPENNKWFGWQDLGGSLTSAPSATSWGDGNIDVFWRGDDMHAWSRAWNGKAWGSEFRVDDV